MQITAANAVFANPQRGKTPSIRFMRHTVLAMDRKIHGLSGHQMGSGRCCRKAAGARQTASDFPFSNHHAAKIPRIGESTMQLQSRQKFPIAIINL